MGQKCHSIGVGHLPPFSQMGLENTFLTYRGSISDTVSTFWCQAGVCWLRALTIESLLMKSI